MKKLILSLLLMGFATIVFSAKITVIRSNPSPQGTYSDVREHHEGHAILFNKSHRLSCKDPGPTVCGWNYPPMTPGGSAIKIENEVRDLINSGQLSGSTTINGVLVTWNGDGINDYTLTMEYDDVEE